MTETEALAQVRALCENSLGVDGQHPQRGNYLALRAILSVLDQVQPSAPEVSTAQNRAELIAAGVPTNTVDALYPSALKTMVQKIDERDKRVHSGYVTTRDEVIAILGEVSKLVPASVIEESLPESMGDNCVAVEIKFALTLERDQL